ncbi:unnamed protein product [Cylicocyclus nassatus]|uniref:Alkyl transferase n=1 Tax=Cylicocyclus nassatus TaxID=53992 RepID=A0AA36DSV5_CYLNA|nr:unnamed protein product [Cylicocyclus nassatus]
MTEIKEVKNDKEEDSAWWDTAKSENAWWHSIVKAIITAGPVMLSKFVSVSGYNSTQLNTYIYTFYVPYHVAFVMDGNRRFARSHHLGRVIRGHEKGFQQLAKVLEWCQDLGVREVTVYAFSIENFKRSSEEVNGLMHLAEKMFAKLLAERDKLEEKQIAFRFFGNIAMLPAKLRKLIAQIQLRTKDYDRGTVNVCMPYTSTDEIARAFELIRKGRQKGLLEENQISEWLVSRCLDSRLGTDPNMLIRTSGEKRLSDFLLWQCISSHLYFDEVLWPDFNYWHLCKAILSYQYHSSSIQEIRRNHEAREPSNEEQLALQPFLKYVDDLHFSTLQEYANLEV